MGNRIFQLVLVFFSFFVQFASAEIQWLPWSNDLFTRAAKEKKLVILDLEAVWCHWCHVMEHETYSKEKISKLIKEKFIPVKVDQDARPDISRRYEDYGWPATIIFNEKGEEIFKLTGFQEPEEFLKTLEAAVKNPVPQEAEVAPTETGAGTAAISDELKATLIADHNKYLDTEIGGLDTRTKYLESDSIEYALKLVLAGDQAQTSWAKKTLDNNGKLIDRVWGGVYQYSTHSDWDHPHFEKIMQTQYTNLLMYSHAFSIFKDPKYKENAGDVYRFLTTKLSSPEGTFYVSQDADVVQGVHGGEFFTLNAEERAEKGTPRIDTHVYARENGWAIEGIVAFASAINDTNALEKAKKAADWIYTHRHLQSGGYSHDEKDLAGPFLGDSLMMGRAWLALYGATGDRFYLTRAEEAMNFISNNFFVSDQPGAVTVKPDPSSPFAPSRSTEENVSLARFSNLLASYLGNTTYKKLAERVLRHLTKPSIASAWIIGDSVLLATDEYVTDPMHLTVVGHKDDPQAQALFAAARAVPSRYKRLEWWDKREGKMPNEDVQYPELDKAAAYICTNKRCSLPIVKPEVIEKTVAKYSKWALLQ